MDIRKIALVTVITVMSSVSIAAGFDGPFVQAGVGFAESATDVHFTNWFTAKPSDNSFAGQISAGYSKSFGRFNLAGNVYYVLGHQKAGTTIQAWEPSQVDTVNMKLQNARGVSIEPGLNINEASLVYVKLGYSQAEGTWTFTRPNDSYSATPTFHGFSFGAGAKHKFSNHLYGFAEVQKTSFKRKNV
ncbi:MAG: outer membrane beta-barrel protein, partial [Burkholderiaceae bacterium]|nr:outer membrane beta-barrel protein [Burkholderiaceae bacterium]